MSKAMEFLKDDLTAVVEAGMSVEDLNRFTGAEGQTAGLDPPYLETSTVGGTIIADRSGSHAGALGQGTRLRDAHDGGPG